MSSFPAFADARLLRGLEIGLLAVLAMQAGGLIWGLSTPAGPSLAGDGGRPGQAFEDLAALDPFGRDGSGASASVPADDLRLVGVRVAGSGGSAILQTGSAPQHTVAIGDEVMPGWTLQAVEADHVQLAGAGRQRRIDLAEASATRAPAGTSVPVPGPVAAAASRVVPMAFDPAQLISQVGLQPRERNGEVTGYTLMPRGDDRLLRQLGLQAGDVLISINGQALDAERLMELSTELGSAPRTTISFERDGQIHRLALDAP